MSSNFGIKGIKSRMTDPGSIFPIVLMLNLSKEQETNLLVINLIFDNKVFYSQCKIKTRGYHKLVPEETGSYSNKRKYNVISPSSHTYTVCVCTCVC